MQKFTVTLGLATVLLFSGALEAKKFPMTAATAVPGAEGRVEVNKDKNGNLKLEIRVEHLANPQSLTPPAQSYVVWLQEKGGSPENQGQLKVDKNLKGEFETVTSSRNFDLFITAEPDPNAKTPSGLEVLRTSVQP